MILNHWFVLMFLRFLGDLRVGVFIFSLLQLPPESVLVPVPTIGVLLLRFLRDLVGDIFRFFVGVLGARVRWGTVPHGHQDLLV